MCRHTYQSGGEHPQGPDACSERAPGAEVGGARYRVDRRTLLAGGAATLAALAGCGSSDSGAAPDAVGLTTEDRCEVCGMVIPNHPGPSAEIFYADERPSGHDNPARFDSTWEAFQYDFERRDRGWSREAFYVTDYSAVDYSVTEEGGDRVVSTYPKADAFVDAESVTFVVGSDVKGAMGKDLIAFSTESDAESFADEYGGSLAGFDDVSRETIAQLGRA
ncbi:NosL family protein [Halosimplex carlsbadense 2-9-1]|uniref:NosL family protein n=1 Tax=Halosimplex carlsbadense 2-9-1 TaxID=797114 RepID=M0CP16_9EURY|nr:nitrous oxide reductase accessory protein NosL [Halosimplex carlsbadense]ELZ24981.1 NosL family protein [Halosimplex carlsbadense 2-9-1]